MFKKLVAVHPLDNMKLLTWFEGGETKVYDVSLLMTRWEVFHVLEDEELFQAVQVDVGGYGVVWNDQVDISADELYENGTDIPLVDTERSQIVYEFVRLRKEAGFSQAQLEEAAGVRQPVIARLETGESIPRVDTLLKVLAPLGKTLAIVDLQSVGEESFPISSR